MGSMPVSNMPGPRTNPTVKSMAHSSQKSLRAWQVTLGPITVVLLIGIVTGCMACAFYLGFFSGQKVGLETALNSNLSTAIRLPIAGAESGRAEDDSDDVFASLGESKNTKPHQEESIQAKAKSVPELEPIKTTDAAPVNEETLGTEAAAGDIAAIKEALQKKPDAHGEDAAKTAPAKVEAPNIEVAKQDAHTESTIEVAKSGSETTLGSLKEQEKIKETVAKEHVVIQERGGVITSKPQVQAQQPPPSTTTTLVPEKAVVSKATFSKPRPGWYAQIAAPNVKSEADALAQKLHGSGFAIAIEDAEVRGKHFYRVLVGPEENRGQAERLITQLKRESSVKGDPFLKNVK